MWRMNYGKIQDSDYFYSVFFWSLVIRSILGRHGHVPIDDSGKPVPVLSCRTMVNAVFAWSREMCFRLCCPIHWHKIWRIKQYILRPRMSGYVAENWPVCSCTIPSKVLRMPMASHAAITIRIWHRKTPGLPFQAMRYSIIVSVHPSDSQGLK